MMMMKNGYMKKLCNGQGSISTLEQQQQQEQQQPMPTLEEMILRLEMEEEEAVEKEMVMPMRRRSCVDSSDRILRSAKNALNQYPRFSLDGKDAICRSSFGTSGINTNDNFGGRRSSSDKHCDSRTRTRKFEAATEGEGVVWCKPGVVAKLMGLDALPVPLVRRSSSSSSSARVGKLSSSGYRCPCNNTNNSSCSVGLGFNSKSSTKCKTSHHYHDHQHKNPIVKPQRKAAVATAATTTGTRRPSSSSVTRDGGILGLGSDCVRTKYFAFKPIDAQPQLASPTRPTHHLL